MRSRYTAHVIGDDQHLFRTWHPRTRQGTVSAGDVEWTGLRVLETWQGQPGDTRGVVEFEAGYVDRTPRIMHERSQFEWRASRWLYVGAIGAGAAEPLE